MLLTHLRGEEPTIYPDFPYSRYHNTDDVSWMQEMGYGEEALAKQLTLSLF
jgi:DNA (cytosine-5)-methyltransferase 1